MKGFLCLVFLLVGMFCFATAAAPEKSSPQHPSIQVIRYKSDADADAIIKNIIAQYEKLGGTSEIYNLPSTQTIKLNQK